MKKHTFIIFWTNEKSENAQFWMTSIMDVWTVNRLPRTLFFKIPTDLSNILFSDYSKSESFWGRQKYKWIEFVGLDCLGFIVFILF